MKRKTEPNCLCHWCGGAFRVPPSRLKTAKYCSPKCRGAFLGKQSQKRVSKTCPACGDKFDVPECHEDRRKYCSLDCRNGDTSYLLKRSERFRGPQNPMWKGGRVKHADGYIYRSVGVFHPFGSNGYVLEHRLVMERYLIETDPDSPFLVQLGFHRYLSPDFEVHHKDEDKQNNAVLNLVCLTPSQHRTLHNDKRKNSS